MLLEKLICVPSRERALHGWSRNSQSENSGRQRCMDRADVLRFVLTSGKTRRQPVRNDRAAQIEVTLPLLIRRFITCEGISCIEGCILEQQLRVSMKRSHAS